MQGLQEKSTKKIMHKNKSVKKIVHKIHPPKKNTAQKKS